MILNADVSIVYVVLVVSCMASLYCPSARAKGTSHVKVPVAFENGYQS